MTSPRTASPGAPDSRDSRAGAAAAPDPPRVRELVEETLPLVTVVARQLGRQLGGRVGLDDLVSYGHEGLLTAARTFDPSLGVPFRRWANYRVRGAMIDGVRGMSSLPRSVYRKLRGAEAAHHASEAASESGSASAVASAEEADARLGEYLAGIATAVAIGLLAAPPDSAGDSVDPSPAADDRLGQSQTLEAVREALGSLSEHERHLIQRHYFDDVHIDEAAREIGLSKSWGCRLHARAIEALTRHMKRVQPR